MTRYDPATIHTADDPATEHHDLSGNGAAGPAEPSTLEMLRTAAEAEAAAAQAAAEDTPPLVLWSPGAHIRVDCSPEQIGYRQLHAARKAALPRRARRGGQTAWDEMDPTAVAARIIAQQTVGLWVRRDDGTYRKVVDSHGEPVDLTDPHLLATFGTADADAAVRKIFGTDPHLLDAGEEVLAHSGWSASGDLDDPPATPKPNGAST